MRRCGEIDGMVDECPDEERRLRIAMIHDEPLLDDATGVSDRPDDLVSALTRRGHEVEVFTPPEARDRDFSTYDVVHAFDSAAVPRARGPLVVRTLTRHPFRGIRSARGRWRTRRHIAGRGARQLWGSVTATATVLSTPDAAAGAPWARTVIPHGIDRSVFAANPRRQSSRPTVLFVGTWNGPDHGAQLAWHFARTVARRVPEAQLRMVTSDEPVGAPDGVVTLGSLDQSELLEEYHRAWVFCLSSEAGEPGALLEAMSAGLPVVAMPTAYSRRVTRDGHDGVVVGFAGLADVLVSLLTSATARRRMARRAYARAQEYDIDTVAEQYEDVYRARLRARRAVLDRRGSPGPVAGPTPGSALASRPSASSSAEGAQHHAHTPEGVSSEHSGPA